MWPLIGSIAANLVRSKAFWIAVVVSVIASHYFYTDWVIADLRETKSKHEATIEEQKKRITTLQKDYKEIILARDELFADSVKLNKEKEELQRTLYRENRKKKSIENLAIHKSTLVQKIINKASDETLSCFETLSEGGEC